MNCPTLIATIVLMPFAVVGGHVFGSWAANRLFDWIDKRRHR